MCSKDFLDSELVVWRKMCVLGSKGGLCHGWVSDVAWMSACCGWVFECELSGYCLEWVDVAWWVGGCYRVNECYVVGSEWVDAELSVWISVDYVGL